MLPAAGTMTERPFFSSRRHPAINYDLPPSDAVSALAQKVSSGETRLRFDPTSGYLMSVLEALKVPVESQAVVFSKTSLQSHYISPANPRALFFTDEVAVGFIRGAPLLEISALDPRQGVVFFVIDQKDAARPLIVRSDSCLSCHESRNSMGIPGMLARSMAVGDGGQIKLQFGTFNSDHRSPFEERWGGWFITGLAGTAAHMGNTMVAADATGRPAGQPKPLASLDGAFAPDGYPARYSDVGAVMTLNHQIGMTNLMIRMGWESRIAVHQGQKNPADRGAGERLIEADARELADYMLFVDEPALPGTFESTSGFKTAFAAAGPRDSQGRSLRQLDLGKRLMRYPLSYMIYSRAFDGLPDVAREAVYSRLWTILSGQDKSTRYSRLTAADRSAIVGILLETKPGLPSYYKAL
ncbi:MAG TPA: hypothetical protein VFY29_06015 [Terriglobia bacterium]|nr:hypothetical protein [Terriglobia bacterium]